MSFTDDLKGLIHDMLLNVSLLKVKTIRSIGRKPMRLEHDSGGNLEFRSDGRVYYNGYEVAQTGSTTSSVTRLYTTDGVTFDGTSANYLIAENDSSGNLEVTVPTGKYILFKSE